MLARRSSWLALSILTLLVAGALPARAATVVVDAAGPDGRAAFKKAAAAARDGDRIELAPGVYDGPVVIASSIAVAPAAGAAVGEVVRVEAASGGAAIVVEAGAKVALGALEVVWRGGPAGAGLRVRGAAVRASGCRIAGGNARGIDVAGESASVVLVGGAVSANAGGGILAREGATVSAEGTELAKNGGTGAEASGAGTRLELARCRIVENGRSGVSASSAATVKLEGCEVARNKGAGLLAQSAGEARVEGGAFRANTDAGLRIAATRRLEVRGALVVGGRTGLALIGGTAGTVEGTAVVGAEGHGVVVEGPGELTLRACLVARNGQDGVVAREKPPALPGTAIVANAGVGLSTRTGGAVADDSLVLRNGRDPEARGPVEAADLLGDDAIVAALARLSDLATALAAAVREEQGDEERSQVPAALAGATARAKARREAFRAVSGTVAVVVRDAAGSETTVAFDLLDAASGKTPVVLAAAEGVVRVRAGSYLARAVEEPDAPGEAVAVPAGGEATVLLDRPRTLRVRLEGAKPLVLALKPAGAIRVRAPRARDRGAWGAAPPPLSAPDAEAYARLRALALAEARALVDAGVDALDGPAGDLAVRTLAEWGDPGDVDRLLAAAAGRAAWLELRIEAARGLARLAAGNEGVAARLEEAVAGRVAPDPAADVRRRARATSVVAAVALVRGASGGPPAARGALLVEARAAEGADGDPALVAFAVEALAAAPREDEAAVYRDLLRYREPGAGPGAALKPPDSAGIFHRSLARRAAAEALARLGDPVGFAWLAASARRYDRFAVSVLVDVVVDPGALLRAGLESDDPEWRLRAAILASDLSEPALVGLLVDAYAAEQRPGRRSLEALRATEDALYALGSPAPVPLEVGRLRGGGSGGLAAALRLARAGHAIALAPLLDWCDARLGEPSERARSAAVLEALGALDAPEARAVLERATAAKDPLVRLAAARTLAAAIARRK